MAGLELNVFVKDTLAEHQRLVKAGAAKIETVFKEAVVKAEIVAESTGCISIVVAVKGNYLTLKRATFKIQSRGYCTVVIIVTSGERLNLGKVEVANNGAEGVAIHLVATDIINDFSGLDRFRLGLTGTGATGMAGN